MSVQASSWVIEHSKHKGSSLLVLLMIANHAHADGTNAFPSLQTLARECRMSLRQISRIVDALEKSGELRVERSGGRLSHRYALPLMQRGQDVVSDNPDILSTLNPDNLSTLADATRTFPTPNVDISAPNVDIAMSPDPSIEPLREKKEEEEGASRERASAPASPKSNVCDEVWLKGLADDPTYAHCDVPFEFGKMARWCEQHNKAPTRSRFVNWLNRIERPMKIEGNGHGKATEHQPRTAYGKAPITRDYSKFDSGSRSG